MVEVIVLDIVPIDQDLSVVCVVESLDELLDSRLTAARSTHETDFLPLADFKTQLVEDLIVP